MLFQAKNILDDASKDLLHHATLKVDSKQARKSKCEGIKNTAEKKVSEIENKKAWKDRTISSAYTDSKKQFEDSFKKCLKGPDSSSASISSSTASVTPSSSNIPPVNDKFKEVNEVLSDALTKVKNQQNKEVLDGSRAVKCDEAAAYATSLNKLCDKEDFESYCSDKKFDVSKIDDADAKKKVDSLIEQIVAATKRCKDETPSVVKVIEHFYKFNGAYNSIASSPGTTIDQLKTKTDNVNAQCKSRDAEYETFLKSNDPIFQNQDSCKETNVVVLRAGYLGGLQLSSSGQDEYITMRNVKFIWDDDKKMLTVEGQKDQATITTILADGTQSSFVQVAANQSNKDVYGTLTTLLVSGDAHKPSYADLAAGATSKITAKYGANSEITIEETPAAKQGAAATWKISSRINSPAMFS